MAPAPITRAFVCCAALVLSLGVAPFLIDPSGKGFSPLPRKSTLERRTRTSFSRALAYPSTPAFFAAAPFACLRFHLLTRFPWPCDTSLLLFCGLTAAAVHYLYRPFPEPGANPVLDLIQFHDPLFYGVTWFWHYLAPLIAVVLGGLFLLSIYHVWIEGNGPRAETGTLPPWPLDPNDAAPSIVIGELHHPVEAKEIDRPAWLTIPERGLYTGLAIFGGPSDPARLPPACTRLPGSSSHGKADNPQRRAAGLVLEVKGDFCHSVRKILKDAGREGDYMGNRPRGPLAMEPARRSLARFLLSCLHHFKPAESAIRKRKGTVLAAGLHQPHPMDS